MNNKKLKENLSAKVNGVSLQRGKNLHENI